MANNERVTLREALLAEKDKPRSFDSSPKYNARGDYLSIVLVDTPYYAERIDEVLTVFRSQSDHTLIGCKVKGVSLLAQNVVNIFNIEGDDVEIRFLLLNAVGPRKARQHYYDLSRKVGSIKLHLPEILNRAA